MKIPEELRRTVLAWYSERGRSWLAALPEVVARLERWWQLTLDGPYPSGSASLVLAVTRRDGTPAVLKVPVLDDENCGEAAVLEHYAGQGAVRLYQADPETGALLLERLEPGTPLGDDSDRGAAIDIVCRLLRRLRRPPPPAHPFPLVRDVARRWAQTMSAEHHRHGCPFPRMLVDAATTLASDLATPDGNEVVVNRDAHLGNVLAAEREPWLLIDPKPLVGEPAFDAGHLLLDLLGTSPPDETSIGRVVERLAAGLGVKATRVRDWALVRAVESTLWSLGVGDDPSRDLTKAARLASLR